MAIIVQVLGKYILIGYLDPKGTTFAISLLDRKRLSCMTPRTKL